MLINLMARSESSGRRSGCSRPGVSWPTSAAWSRATDERDGGLQRDEGGPDAFDRAAAAELRRRQIRVLDIRPTHTETGLGQSPDRRSTAAPARGRGTGAGPADGPGDRRRRAGPAVGRVRLSRRRTTARHRTTPRDRPYSPPPNYTPGPAVLTASGGPPGAAPVTRPRRCPPSPDRRRPVRRSAAPGESGSHTSRQRPRATRRPPLPRNSRW